MRTEYGARSSKHKKHSLRIYSRVKTSQGVFTLEFTKRGIFRIHFPGRSPCPRPGLGQGGAVLRRYFKDPRTRLDSLKLDLTGLTPFQKKVFSVLRKVPAGKVITYGELAKRAGYPGAARAVGNAMKMNRLPIVIPCHRVIKGGGSLGQYSGGVHWKKRLLELEGITSFKTGSSKSKTRS